MPLNLILDGRPVLVVGGGQVGRRKVMSLLDAGASVELVCPDAVDALAELASAGRLAWTRRAWRAGDAAGHLLVFACTDDKHVNRAILDDARAAHVLLRGPQLGGRRLHDAGDGAGGRPDGGGVHERAELCGGA